MGPGMWWLRSWSWVDIDAARVGDANSVRSAAPAAGRHLSASPQCVTASRRQDDFGIVPMTPFTRKFMFVTAALSSAYPFLETSFPAWL